MPALFPENPTNAESVTHEGRVWRYNADRDQWQNVYAGSDRSTVEDVGFFYNPNTDDWHLDVGMMTSV
jgi:hypothetical protein